MDFEMKILDKDREIPMQLNELETYLNQFLDIAHFRDYCPNGLQVEGRSEVHLLISW